MNKTQETQRILFDLQEGYRVFPAYRPTVSIEISNDGDCRYPNGPTVMTDPETEFLRFEAICKRITDLLADHSFAPRNGWHCIDQRWRPGPNFNYGGIVLHWAAKNELLARKISASDFKKTHAKRVRDDVGVQTVRIKLNDNAFLIVRDSLLDFANFELDTIDEERTKKLTAPQIGKAEQLILDTCKTSCLHVLDFQPALIGANLPSSEKTIRSKLNSLEKLGLIHRPNGDKSGFTAK